MEESTICDIGNVRRNLAAINYIRTFGAVIAGILTGILGLTGLNGFICYFAFSALLSGLLRLAVGSEISHFFQSQSAIWTDGVVGGAFTYVLFWTLVYGLVHIY